MKYIKIYNYPPETRSSVPYFTIAETTFSTTEMKDVVIESEPIYFHNLNFENEFLIEAFAKLEKVIISKATKILEFKNI